MAFEIITPGGSPSPATSLSGQPSPSGSGANTPPESAAANGGTVTMEEALKGADHTKMTGFSVSDMANGANKATGGTTMSPSGQSVALGGLVQAKIAIDLADSLIPAALVLIGHRMGLQLRKTSFSLSQGEKNTLTPVVEACLNSINLDFSSPWQTLAVSLLVIYGGKFAEVAGTGWMDKKSAEKTPYKAPEGPRTGLTPVVHMTGQSAPGAPTVVDPAPAASAEAAGFNPGDTPPVWTEADVAAVIKKRRKGPADAQAWLQRNWVKKGGRI